MNLLITGAWSQAKDCVSSIQEMGHRVVFMQKEKDNLPCAPDWVEGVICNSLLLSHPIEKFPNLRYIQLTSVGLDRVPMDYIHEHEIEIHNAGNAYCIPMAEFAVASVLNVYKRMRDFAENQRKHKWEKYYDLRELAGKTVMILGCGNLGRECAKRFKAFDSAVVGINRTIKDIPYFDQIISLESLEDVIVHADIIIIALALTDQTKGLINQKIMDKVKEDAVIVNLSRGAIIDAENQSRTAAQDVFETEPLESSNALWDKNNIIITPHNSYVGEGNEIRLRNIILENLQAGK